MHMKLKVLGHADMTPCGFFAGKYKGYKPITLSMWGYEAYTYNDIIKIVDQLDLHKYPETRHLQTLQNAQL